MPRHTAYPLAVFLLAGACASGDEGYPSLAPRPIETMSMTEPPQPLPAPVAPDPALDARIAAAERDRVAAAAAFDTGAARAERLATAARGSAAGSDRWLDAQTALAELDSLRAAHAQAVAPLEDLAAERAQALRPAYPALEEMLVRARAASATQTQRIDAIAGVLAPA